MGNILPAVLKDLQQYVYSWADYPIYLLPRCDDPTKYSTMRELFLCDKGRVEFDVPDIVLCKNVHLVVHLHSLRGLDKLEITGASVETWPQATIPSTTSPTAAAKIRSRLPCVKPAIPNITLTLIITVPGLEGDLSVNDLSGCRYLPNCRAKVSFSRIQLHVAFKFDFECTDLRDARIDSVAANLYAFDYECTPVWAGLKLPGVRNAVTQKMQGLLESGIKKALTDVMRRHLHVMTTAATTP
jgi:hypothetical protein